MGAAVNSKSIYGAEIKFNSEYGGGNQGQFSSGKQRGRTLIARSLCSIVKDIKGLIRFQMRDDSQKAIDTNEFSKYILNMSSTSVIGGCLDPMGSERK